MSLPSRRTRRPPCTARTLQAIFLLASLFVLIYYHFIQPRPMYRTSLSVDQANSRNAGGSKLAYATLLLSSSEKSSDENDSDVYFRSIRLLNFQLQHSKYTRSANKIPFLVLVTPDVAQWKRDTLSREGATIIVVEKLNSDWLQPLVNRWTDVMAKLRLWELVQYERILFLDADTFLLKPLDGIFNDLGAELAESLQILDEIKTDEPSLPKTYLFASHPEVIHTSHSYPPADRPTFNAGFMLLSPSLETSHYLKSLLSIKDRFDSTYPEQALLNYAFRETGNMPWGRLSYKWGIECPTMKDVRHGIHSLHAKLWTEGNELQPIEKGLRDKWEAARLEMERLYTATGKGKSSEKRAKKKPPP